MPFCLSDMPSIVTHDVVINIFDVLKRHITCPGNPDETFVSMLKANKGFIASRKSSGHV